MSCCPPQTISYFCEVAPIKVKVMPRLNVIVKLQSKVQASVLGLGVDFVFPLSQEQEEQQEEQQQEQPHQNIPEKSILEVLNFTHRLIP